MRVRTMLSIGGWLSGINILLVIVLMIIGLPRLGDSLFTLVVVSCATQLVAVVFLVLGFVKDRKLPAPASQE